MSDIPANRTIIQLEGAQFRSAVSEALMQGIGGSTNFINQKLFEEKEYKLNGVYSLEVSPQIAADGYSITPVSFDMQIFAVGMYHVIAGSGGVTELDIKACQTSGGTFATIFSTTPKITAAAGNGVWILTGQTDPNMTAAVLVTPTVLIPGGSAIRLDVITAQTGIPNSTGITLFYRAVN